MAKVYPIAELPEREGDIPLTEEQLLDISFIARLSRDRKDKLLKYPGAMKLRQVARGQVICRQNEEGSTAYFILRGADRFRVASILDNSQRDLQAKILNTLGPNRRPGLSQAHNANMALERRRRQIQDRLDARIAAEAALKKQATESEKAGDKERAALLKSWLAAAPEQKLQQAEQLSATDTELAGLLRDVAIGPTEVKSLQAEEQFLRTADAQEKRARAGQVEAKEPDFAAQLRASAAAEDDAPPFAQVQLATLREQEQGGFFTRIKRWFLGKREARETGPSSLPSDAPSELDFRTRRATLFEGDLFGEMACLNRRPRSATVAAMEDGLVLEILGNVLDEIDKDPDYQKERQRVYRRRVLELHLRDLALFRDLSDADYARVVEQVREKVELVSFASGQVICDEHDRSDAIYLVRDGMVQVTKNTSALLRPDQVKDWKKLGDAIKTPTPALAAVLKILSPAALKVMQDTPPTGPAENMREECTAALNELIKSPKLAALAELKTFFDSDAFRRRAYYLPADRKIWNESQLRRGQRLVLEELLPGALAPLPAPSVSGDLILTYLSRGDIFGEIGVVENVPRTASCIAYGQPRMHTDQKDLGRVELVRISQELVRELLTEFPVIRTSIDRIIASRRQQTQTVLGRQEASRGLQPESQQTLDAARLGLIQGQRLMLIDLDRCTRCDECVKACVDSHDDGRTRLFLTGPRFGKYLVPFTCRSCLDPVCMIGCPVRSIQRGENLEIQIKDWCIGCGICARQCPYNSIQIHPLLEGEGKTEAPEGNELVELRGRAAVCDLCSSLADQDPRCVYACPHEAAMRIDFRADFPELQLK